MSSQPASSIAASPSVHAGSGTDPHAENAPAGNTATGWLKIIALGFMLIDHIGAVIFTGVPELRMLGRIAFPLYCWCLIVGFHYTRSVPKYLLRMGIVGLVSQPVYAIAMNHLNMTLAEFRELVVSLPSRPDQLGAVLYAVFNRPNIFLTLLLGLLGLWSLREKKGFSHLWGPVIVLTLATLLNADYGWKGVLFILLLYACRSSRPAIAAVMISFFLFWGTGYSLTQSIFGLHVSLDSLPNLLKNELGLKFLPSLVQAFLAPVGSFLRMETYALFSLPLILIRFRKKMRLPVWISYGIYPAHLLLILLLKAVFL